MNKELIYIKTKKTQYNVSNFSYLVLVHFLDLLTRRITQNLLIEGVVVKGLPVALHSLLSQLSMLSCSKVAYQKPVLDQRP